MRRNCIGQRHRPRSRTSVQIVVIAALGHALAAHTPIAHAQTPTTLPAVVVQGEAERAPVTRVTEDVEASPASVTVIDKRSLDRKTLTTYGDIFRGVTGLNVLEYGQGTVAYDIQMRGFDGGHGRNIAVYLDGVPLNVTGSQHTNGYMDLAQLIPEVLNRVEIMRGPFSAYAGNHAVAGSIQFTTDANVGSGLKVSIDNFGRARLLPIANLDAGPGKLLIALDATKGNAYTKQSDLERLNLFTRYSMPLANGLASVRIQLYDADAEAPGYIDRARVQSGAIGKREFLSHGIGDVKRQQNIVFNYRSNDVDGETGLRGGWFASLYVVRDERKRWTNFDLTTPLGASVNLGQERDRLNQSGFDLRKTTSFSTLGRPSQLVAGVQLNSERVRAQNFQTDADRNPLQPSAAIVDPIGVDRTVQTDTRSLYTQLQVQPFSRMKITGGLRYDHLNFKIRLRPNDDAFTPAQNARVGDTIEQSASQLSPKLGVGLNLYDGAGQKVEAFGNAARGLKSPYPFADFFGNLAAVNSVPDLRISSVKSFEGGLQGGAKNGSTRWRTAVWSTRQERETDRNQAGVLSSFKKTSRDGFDLEGTVDLTGSVRLFANYSQVRARIKDPATVGADRIPNVPEKIGTIGILANLSAGPHRFDVTLSNSRVGAQSITTDNALRTRTFNRAIARIAYTNASWNQRGLKGTTVFLNVVGYDRQLDELAFDFGGGAVGISPRPRLQATAGIQIPL